MSSTKMASVVQFSERSLERAYITGDELARVTPGVYDLVYVTHKLKPDLHRHNPKLVMWFRIVTPGEFHGVIVAKYYGVHVKKGADFKAGQKSDFARDYVDLFGSPPQRWDRVPMTNFKGTVIEGSIRTVTIGRAKKGKQQRKIPEPLQYSVIDHLLKIKAG